MVRNKESKSQEKIGNIIGVATRDEIRFVIDPSLADTNPLMVGEFVAVENSATKEIYLGIVKTIFASNDYLLDKFTKDPKTVDIIMEFSQSVTLMGDIRILGRYDERSKTLIIPRFPPKPGDKIYRNPTELLHKIFAQGILEVGSLLANEKIRVKLDVTQLASRHFAILAITGAGKSNTVAVLLKELMTKLKPSIIVIDPHQEYFSLRSHSAFKGKVKIFSPKTEPGILKLNFKVSNFSDDKLVEIVGIPSNATKQESFFRQVVEKVRKEYKAKEKPWGIEEIENDLQKTLQNESESADNKNHARAILSRLRTMPIRMFLDKELETPLSSDQGAALTKRGQLTIIGTGLITGRALDTMIAHLLERIFYGAHRYRRGTEGEKTDGPVLIIIEEAHNFAPSDSHTRSSKIIAKIASEGRKFGVGLGVVTQRPGRISANLLSQCNTQIIMRIVNPRDQNQVIDSAEALSEDLMSDLPSFNKGEAVIIGPAIPLPAVVKIDKFAGDLGGADIDYEKEWSGNSVFEVDEDEYDDFDPS